LWGGTNSDSYCHGFANANQDSDCNRKSDSNSNTNADADANSMLGEMFTDTEAASKFVDATYSASSFNTAASRFAASYTGTAPVNRRVEGNRGANDLAALPKRPVISLTFLLAKLRSNY